MMNALEINQLSKSFPHFTLGPLNLALPSGCIMGLVGENGAGKSTTFKLILNMLRSDSGTISILGKDNRENLRMVQEDIGVVLDEVGLPECLNAKEVSAIMRRTFRNWNNAEYIRLLDRLSLPENKPFKDFSRGMKMKLGIAIALSHGSKLLLLDEATSGLDPVVRDEISEMFLDFTRSEDHSILISSHIVSDLEKLCDIIAFLHNGKLLLCEEKDRLLAEYALAHCTLEQLNALPAEAVRCAKTSPYGAEAMVLRHAVPAGIALSPISIEELFVFMAKEAKEQ